MAFPDFILNAGSFHLWIDQQYTLLQKLKKFHAFEHEAL